MAQVTQLSTLSTPGRVQSFVAKTAVSLITGPVSVTLSDIAGYTLTTSDRAARSVTLSDITSRSVTVNDNG